MYTERMMNVQFAIYCRKSTDTEDKQVLSLESQEYELKELAKRESLDVAIVLTEKASAKAPGRPVFNQLLHMLTTGVIGGILCWKIDRLTRNPIDGGQLQWLLQSGQIKCIKTFDRCYYPSDNVLLINIEQAMATQYIRDLSTNVKRGNRAKLERGEWPNHAPLGYYNDKGTKTIRVDRKIAPFIKRAFELYVTNEYSLQTIANMLFEEGLRTKTGNKVFKSQVHNWLNKSFYCGLMERDGKLYKGNHKPIISTQLFNFAQDILNDKRHTVHKKHFYAARGFLTCGNCGCVLTADKKKGITYYYCTNGKGHCDQHKRYLRSETIDKLIAETFTQLQFDPKLLAIAERAYNEKAGNDNQYIQHGTEKLQKEAKLLQEKEMMLVEGFTSKIIREEVYIAKMKELQNKQLQLQLQITQLEESTLSKVTFEQVKTVLLQANNASKLYFAGNDAQKRNYLQTVLSNICIKDKKVLSSQFKSPFDVLARAPKKRDFFTLLAVIDGIRKALLTNHSIATSPVIDISHQRLREAG